MAGKYIEKALEKCDELPKELIKNMEQKVLLFQAGSVDYISRWHDENEVNPGDVVVELIYRVRVLDDEN